jgi:hypothetical protein
VGYLDEDEQKIADQLLEVATERRCARLALFVSEEFPPQSDEIFGAILETHLQQTRALRINPLAEQKAYIDGLQRALALSDELDKLTVYLGNMDIPGDLKSIMTISKNDPILREIECDLFDNPLESFFHAFGNIVRRQLSLKEFRTKRGKPRKKSRKLAAQSALKAWICFRVRADCSLDDLKPIKKNQGFRFVTEVMEMMITSSPLATSTINNHVRATISEAWPWVQARVDYVKTANARGREASFVQVWNGIQIAPREEEARFREQHKKSHQKHTA